MNDPQEILLAILPGIRYEIHKALEQYHNALVQAYDIRPKEEAGRKEKGPGVRPGQKSRHDNEDDGRESGRPMGTGPRARATIPSSEDSSSGDS